MVSTFGERKDIELRINKVEYTQECSIDSDPLHYHKQSTVFFIVATGIYLVEVEGETIELNQDSVLEIKPGTKYKAKAVIKAPCICITVGTYNDEGDRVVVEK